MSGSGFTAKIRFRLVLGFVLAFMGMALFGVISYRYFVHLEEKLVFLSQADGLLNDVLEVRRYEKNYFLYRHEKDFSQALAYLDGFNDRLAAQRDHLVNRAGRPVFDELSGLAAAYGRRFDQVHRLLAASQEGEKAGEKAGAAIEELRALGQELISRSEDLAERERLTIRTLLRDYRPLLIGFLVALCVIGGLVAYSLIARLVLPLKTIEEATRIVAAGDYQVIPWTGRGDEIGSLVQGFNRMVRHLRQNNEQLVQTEKLTALGTLTSGVAHELNNPLNNISTSCQILLEEAGDGLPPYHRDLLTAVEGQVNQAKGIVSLLLEYARQREFELRPEDLRAVVEETLKLIKGEIPGRVQVRLDIPAGITVELDKAHLVQALINLIMNAIQAMPEGGVLTLTGRASAYDDTASLEVADTGQGIPPEAMPRIFDPFFTTKEVGRGTGLGLSITLSIIERHNGHIQARSEPDRGAAFVLTLPLKAEGG